MYENARTVGPIGIIGDRDPQYPLHIETENALADAAGRSNVEWIATGRLDRASDVVLSHYSGFLVSPSSRYRSMQGALSAIRYARLNRVPLLGTCAGFQHMLIEFARNVAGLPDADHAETNPDASHLAVTPLVCSLAGQVGTVRVVAGTLAASVYAMEEIQEPFFCNYGLNREHGPLLESYGLRFTGFGTDGTVRIVELPTHPFFVGTLYVPQAGHASGKPHLLVNALVAAARRRQARGEAAIKTTLESIAT
jgi:CTP synthase (UTP-ammonia lyase)